MIQQSRRLLKTPEFYPDESLYLTSIKSFRERRSFYHDRTALLEVNSIEALDINDQQSFALVELYMTQIIEQPDNPLFDSFLWIKNDFGKLKIVTCQAQHTNNSQLDKFEGQIVSNKEILTSNSEPEIGKVADLHDFIFNSRRHGSWSQIFKVSSWPKPG